MEEDANASSYMAARLKDSEGTLACHWEILTPKLWSLLKKGQVKQWIRLQNYKFHSPIIWNAYKIVLHTWPNWPLGRANRGKQSQGHQSLKMASIRNGICRPIWGECMSLSSTQMTGFPSFYDIVTGAVCFTIRTLLVVSPEVRFLWHTVFLGQTRRREYSHSTPKMGVKYYKSPSSKNCQKTTEDSFDKQVKT